MAGFQRITPRTLSRSNCIFTPFLVSLFSVFSESLASVPEGTSFAGAGLAAIGCSWKLL